MTHKKVIELWLEKSNQNNSRCPNLFSVTTHKKSYHNNGSKTTQQITK